MKAFLKIAIAVLLLPAVGYPQGDFVGPPEYWTRITMRLFILGGQGTQEGFIVVMRAPSKDIYRRIQTEPTSRQALPQYLEYWEKIFCRDAGLEYRGLLKLEYEAYYAGRP